MVGLREKWILKEIGRGMLPARILERKKFPFRAPDIEYFLTTSSGRQILEEALDPAGLESFGFFDPGKVQALAAKVGSVAKTTARVTTSDNLVLMSVLSGQIFDRLFRLIGSCGRFPSVGPGATFHEGNREGGGRMASDGIRGVICGVHPGPVHDREALEFSRGCRPAAGKGILDSTGVLELVGFIEENFVFSVEDEELLPDNLGSVDNIVGMSSGKQGAASPDDLPSTTSDGVPGTPEHAALIIKDSEVSFAS